MESGQIRDDAITATQSHAASSTPPYSRLNTESGAGAWCHGSIASDTRDEYLQVNYSQGFGLLELNLS